MAISREKIENLLFEDESAVLDFKRNQYPFNGENDLHKAELLKDILAFSNAWRRADAFILIGVEEVKGKKSRVVGVSQHLDDANLQQFVNSKTQRPVDFSYHAIEIEGKQIGIIHIPLQRRPIFLKKKFSRLEKNVVYIRRGSSTGEANPDEIAKMGENLVIPEITIPVIDLQYGRAFERSLLGDSVELKATVLTIPTKKQIEDCVNDLRRRNRPESGSAALSSMLFENNYNRNKYSVERLFYFMDLAEYLKRTSFLDGIHLVISNIGAVTANDVQVEIEVKDPQKIFYFKDECFLPEKPKDPFPFNFNIPSFNQYQEKRSFYIEKNLENWHISTSFQKVLPKQTLWTDRRLFVGASESTKLILPVKVFAANLPKPMEFEFTMAFEVSQNTLTLQELVGNKL